eukprot:102527-Rhodomonas_salina.1
MPASAAASRRPWRHAPPRSPPSPGGPTLAVLAIAESYLLTTTRSDAPLSWPTPPLCSECTAH